MNIYAIPGIDGYDIISNLSYSIDPDSPMSELELRKYNKLISNSVLNRLNNIYDDVNSASEIVDVLTEHVIQTLNLSSYSGIIVCLETGDILVRGY